MINITDAIIVWDLDTTGLPENQDNFILTLTDENKQMSYAVNLDNTMLMHLHEILGGIIEDSGTAWVTEKKKAA